MYDLQSYLQLNTSILCNRYCSWEELENMMPWERDVYVELINNYLQEQKEKTEKANK